MSQFEKYEPMMLEYLYGLLEADEVRELEAFLATPEGAVLRAQTAQMQAKIGKAARQSFPQVQFTPPQVSAKDVVRPQRPTRAPIGTVWTRWAVAASLLVVFGGLGGPAAYQAIGWWAQSRDSRQKQAVALEKQEKLTQAKAELAARQKTARDEIDSATKANADLGKNYSEAMASVIKAVQSKDFRVRLTGPSRIQPGAPNEWRIEALDQQGRRAQPEKMEVVVKDAKEVELARRSYDKPAGSETLKLPASFWEKVKPGDDLFLEVVAYTKDNRKSVVAEKVPLARPVYVTHLATDKPLYKPGEVVRFRSLTLDRSTLLPPTHDQHLRFRLRDPSDAFIPLGDANGRVLNGADPVLGPDGKPLRGLGVGEHAIPADAPGGEYKLDVVEVEANGREILLETRKFLVNRYVPDVFEKKLEFDAQSYGPNDVVQARIDVSRTAGGPMKDARAVIEVRQDGRPQPIYTERNVELTILSIPGTGRTRSIRDVRFKLPADLFEVGSRKDIPPSVSLTVTIMDGTDSEAIVRPVPIVTRKLSVDFFPEGGEAIEGVPGRIYFQVRTPLNKPADLKGRITDGTNTIATVTTMTDAERPGVNRGLGVFDLTPAPGKKYFLKLDTPIGIEEPTKDGFPLPVAKADGVALMALDAVTERDKPIRVRLQVGQGKKMLQVGAYARGRLINHQRLEVAAGKPVDVALNGDEALGGVTRITVFEEPAGEEAGRVNLIPRAERLVYRNSSEQLILTANPDRVRYSPSGKVRLDLGAMNEKESPVPAVLMVGVVNQSPIVMADNKTDRLMPTHFLLSGEVKHPSELEHADFLLTDHPKAGVSLDLLLGTQGWRRFAEQSIVPESPADRREVDRMLVSHGQRSQAPFELLKAEQQKIDSEFRPKQEQTALRVAMANQSWNQFRSSVEPALMTAVTQAESSHKFAQQEYQSAAAELFEFETRIDRLKTFALPLFVVGLVGLTIGGVVIASRRQPGERRSYVLASAGSFGLAMVMLGVTLVTEGTDATQSARRAVDQERAMARGGVTTRNAPMNPKMMEMKDAGPPRAAGRPADFAPANVEGLPGPRGFEVPKMEPAPPLPKPEPLPKPVVFKPEAIAAKARNANDKGDRRDVREMMKVPFGGFPHPDQRVGGGAAFPGARGPQVVPTTLPSIVREFAHQRDASLGQVRSDFTETVYWHPVLVLPASGKASVEFQLSDDIARYQVMVAGHTLDGRVGAVVRTIESRKPFTVDPKVPLEINSNDIVDVPVRVTNDTDDRRTVEIGLNPVGLRVEGAATTPDGKFKEIVDLGPNGKARRVFRMRPTQIEGDIGLAVIGSSTPAADPDEIGRALRVVPEGYPVTKSHSDMLESIARGTFELPKDVIPGTLKARLDVHPSMLSQIVKGLEGMLSEPHGCFEQTSTTNYPNTLVLNYLSQSQQASPEFAKRARDLLTRGYSKLTSFECPDTPLKARRGFEWFGATDSAHEALTAYGLLQFKDMSRVHAVDPELIRRTQAYLMSRRDGKGGFLRNPRALDTFGAAPKHTTDAYITWALIESDPDNEEKLDLKTELEALKSQAMDEQSRGGKDAYFVGLVANSLLLRGDRDTAVKLLDRLTEKHLKDGRITGSEISVTSSGGRDLEIESTALAMFGWLRANEPRYASPIVNATKWITQQRQGSGTFGGTQSTIMTLKALILYAKKSARPTESGVIKIVVDGKTIASRSFSPNDIDVISIDVPDAEKVLPIGGKVDFEVTTTGKNPYPFSFSYKYSSLTPVSGEQCPVRIETTLAKNTGVEGQAIPLTVNVENVQDKDQAMTVAIVGLPAGLKVPTDMKQLTDLREKGVISYFELRGREVVLYWRGLGAKRKVSLTLDLICDVPGEYRGPASRAYLYYNADHKHWIAPLSVKIAPSSGKEEAVVER